MDKTYELSMLEETTLEIVREAMKNETCGKQKKIGVLGERDIGSTL